MTELPENYERDMQVFEELNRTAFPNASQIQAIHNKAKELGYDKVELLIDTRGSSPSIRYSFIKGRKHVNHTWYIVLSKETADLIDEANRRREAGLSD